MTKPDCVKLTAQKDKHSSVEESNKQQTMEEMSSMWNTFSLQQDKQQKMETLRYIWDTCDSQQDKQSPVWEPVANSTLKTVQQDNVEVMARKDKHESVKPLTKDSLLFGKPRNASRKDEHSSVEDLIDQQRTAEDYKKMWNLALKVPGNEGILLRKVSLNNLLNIVWFITDETVP